ncbi:MAG: DUF4403 family protein [Mesorhizobium sp.]|uniref:DUF4403 family protein n=1 Tax=Mesorhizobium sp. TaxID=1871066 RepID=UPI000FE5AC6A|nr:DUF4403 family protein [Mesorhizobium sp.]RWL94323.1 MAG: DUF4403 family protein [Mesorhizobium sp.]TIP50174.1 MAG: DUF4403 family protein [Mesorhizobium sp.]TJV70248.1 MAG: DUF4403 family protein [Mesorhizobium sp.]
MTNRRKFMLSAAAALMMAGSGLAYEAYRQHNVRLSQQPFRIAGDIKIPAHDSLLALRADVPLSLIRDAASQAIPAEYGFGGNGPDVGGTINPGGWNFVKIDVKAGTRYEGTVRRIGDLTVSGSGHTVLVALPIEINGKGGFRGDGARMLGLNAKNFRAALIIRARVTIDINPDWTPAVTIVPELEWTQNPKVEVVSRAWVDIRSHVEGPMRAQLEAMAAKIRAAIPADTIKREIEKAWRVYSMPIGNAGSLTAWAHLVPVEIGTSGVVVANNQIHVGVSLKARTDISTDATPKVEVSPLPALSRMPAEPGRLSIAAPVRVDYNVLRAAVMAEVADKKFSAEIAGGKATVIVKDIVVYPSAETIAVGLSFEARLPGHLFDVTGKLFLTGKPVVENEGTVVHLVDVRFARQLDNPFWNLVSVIFEDQIRHTIENSARADLASEIAKQVAALRLGLADPSKTQGVKVTIRDVKVGFDSIVPEAEDLAALIRVDVGIDTELTALPQAKTGKAI